MGRGFIQILAFVSGLLVAAVIAFRPQSTPRRSATRVIAQPLSVNLAQPAKTSPFRTNLDAPRGMLVSPNSLNEDSSLVIKVLPLEEKQNIILDAVREGSPGGIRVLSPRVLVSIPEYRRTLMPLIKDEALSALLARFREADWSNWSLSSFARDGGPTVARAYVDLVHSVNSELGQFLETSAMLMGRLGIDTIRGEVFIPERELLEAIREPEAGSEQTSSGTLYETGLDANILEDASFRNFLERLRARVIEQRLQTTDTEPLEAFRLLLSIQPEFVDLPSSKRLIVLLRQFALDASPRYRDEVFRALREAPSFTDVSAKFQTLRRALAELYLIGVIDAIDRNDRGRASIFMDESMQLYPGLHSQELLRTAMANENFGKVVPAKATLPNEKAIVPETKASEPSTPFRLSRTKGGDLESSLQVGFSFLASLILVVVVLAAVFYVFIYYRSVKSLERSRPVRAKPQPKAKVPMTSAASMNFDSDFSYDGPPAAASIN